MSVGVRQPELYSEGGSGYDRVVGNLDHEHRTGFYRED
jgi:hypothetical protein